MGNRSRSGHKRRQTHAATKPAVVNPTTINRTTTRPADKPNDLEMVRFQHQEKHIEMHFTGPIPHPMYLKAYNEIDPGFGGRIIAMAEKQQEHRFTLETKDLNGDIHRANLGLWLAFFVAVIGIGGGFYLLTIDKFNAGYITMFVPLGSLVGSFIYAQVKRNKELKARSQNPSEPSKTKP